MAEKKQALRIGELAKAVGKSVRAIHLYEELGLVQPMTRSAGGFRLFAPDAIARINWITKLQVIGFSLAEIQGFCAEFETADSGRDAAIHVRDVFEQKLQHTREQLDQLKIIENDLVEAIEYLESCQGCETIYPVEECSECDHQGHRPGRAPELFAGLTVLDDGRSPAKRFDVAVSELTKETGKN